MQLVSERTFRGRPALAAGGEAGDGGGRLRVAAAGVAAALLGAAPHVLHHAGPVAGVAILGGTRGSLLFGAVGFLLAIPLLARVHDRTGSWKVPVGLLALFAVLFTLSTTILGPVLTAADDAKPAPVQSAPEPSPGGNPSEHDAHHD